jgi:formimidoylglutamate deiminase
MQVMPASLAQVIEADLTWSGRRFERDVRVSVDADGRIAGVGALNTPASRRLSSRALIPGMINAHSHAFQRGLRGHGETFPPRQGRADFWTWRQAMYALVETLDEPKLHALCVQCFREMLAAGVTTVGEFHYLHHNASLKGFAFDEVVLRAAQEVGIRIALIESYYRTGGIDRELAGGQLRFRTNSTDEYWQQIDRLTPTLDRRTQSIAASAHSIRAASIDEITDLQVEASRRGLPFHIHVEEQPQEVADCVERFGKPPMALLNERLEINPMFTAVHCTHTAEADMSEFLSRGGGVCINPLTEGNLGDGIPNLPFILRNGGRVALGSDSNLRLCWTEEMRWLEYAQRLRSGRRGLAVDEEGSCARKLLECATISGAKALGLRAGRIETGCPADFAAIDLTTPSLQGWTDDTLLDAFIFGTGSEAIREVCVGGKWIEQLHR